jgi:hypothetical protein
MNQVAKSPMLAEKIAATVIQPSTLVVRADHPALA